MVRVQNLICLSKKYFSSRKRPAVWDCVLLGRLCKFRSEFVVLLHQETSSIAFLLFREAIHTSSKILSLNHLLPSTKSYRVVQSAVSKNTTPARSSTRASPTAMPATRPGVPSFELRCACSEAGFEAFASNLSGSLRNPVY